MILHGRTALVTGAAQGIGFAIARSLASEGASVALLDLDRERAEKAADQIDLASAWCCDVRDRKQVGMVVREIGARIGPPDILVNSAGIWRHTPVLDVDVADWDEVFEVNVKGVLFCSQAVAETMVRRRSGKIVNIASVAGFVGTPGWSAYCASKAAVISLTLSLAGQLNRHNVHVNAVCPGGTRTSMSEYIAQTEGRSDVSSYHAPEDVAREVLTLVCPFDQSTTGRVVPMKPVDSVLGMAVRK